MKKAFRSPVFYFLFTGILLAVLCLFSIGEAIDINVHDTYFVLDYGFLAILFLLINLLDAIVYCFIRKRIKSFWPLLHLVLQTPFLFAFSCFSLFTGLSGPGRGQDLYMLNRIILGLEILFLLAQLVLVIQILLAIFRPVRSE